MPGLLRPQEIPGAPDLQVLEGDPVTRAEVGVMFQHLQPLLRHRIYQIRGHEIAVGPPVAPAHPAAQLIELGQAELVGIVHHQRVGVGHIQS